MVFKNKLTPLRKGGRIDKFEGKGSQMAAMPDRRQIKGLATGGGGLNNYTKAAPTLPAGNASSPYGTYDLE